MAQAASPSHVYVGIDIAADTFTAAWLMPGGNPTVPRPKSTRGDQTPAGVTALEQRLTATQVPPSATLVVMEPTGN